MPEHTKLARLLRVMEELQSINPIMTVAEALVLLFVASQTDGRSGPTVTSVSERLKLELPRTSRILKVLEDAGLAKRERDPSDFRIKRCTVTAQGFDLLGRITSLV